MESEALRDADSRRLFEAYLLMASNQAVNQFLSDIHPRAKEDVQGAMSDAQPLHPGEETEVTGLLEHLFTHVRQGKQILEQNTIEA